MHFRVYECEYPLLIHREAPLLCEVYTLYNRFCLSFRGRGRVQDKAHQFQQEYGQEEQPLPMPAQPARFYK